MALATPTRWSRHGLQSLVRGLSELLLMHGPGRLLPSLPVASLAGPGGVNIKQVARRRRVWRRFTLRH